MAASSANPVLVQVLRTGEIESRHRGAAVICGSDGSVVESWGDGAQMVFPRSAYKMLQALPLVETGAAARFGLTDRELALACASHNSEPRQVSAVVDWLAKIGCGEGDLACGAHRPYHDESADILVRAGEAPSRLHNNCSGKHTGFLSVARHLETPIEGYAQPGHPVQRRAIAAISEMSDFPADAMTVGVDGCSAPALTLPLNQLALAYARLADPDSLSGERGAAARLLYRAVTTEPYYVAGTGQASTVLMECAGGRAALKTGAEAVYVASIPDLKLGIAVKIDDGAPRASECLIAALLVRLGVLDANDGQVRQFLNPVLKNRAGIDVGEIRPVPAIISDIVPDAGSAGFQAR